MIYELIEYIWINEISQGFYEGDCSHLTIGNIDYIDNVSDGIKITFRNQFRYQSMTYCLEYFNTYKTMFLRSKKLERIYG